MKTLAHLVLFGYLIADPLVKKSHSDAVYSCPAGYLLEGKSCVKKTVVQGIKRCEVGNLVANQCVVQAKTESFCPPNTVPVMGGCQVKDIQLPQRICPPGTHDIGGECQSYTVTGIVEVCDEGEIENGECAVYESVPGKKTAGCPLGYSEAKGSCWKSVELDCTPPSHGKRSLQAKTHMLSNGKKGYHTQVPTTPLYVPPQAKLEIKNKRCDVKLEADPVSSFICPNGSIERNGQCVIRTVKPTDVSCSLGEDYLCFPFQSTPSISVCQPGYQLINDRCEKASIVPKETKCVDGAFSSPNGGCMKFERPPVTQCPPGTQLVGDQCFGKEITQPTVQVTVTCQGKNCYQ